MTCPHCHAVRPEWTIRFEKMPKNAKLNPEWLKLGPEKNVRFSTMEILEFNARRKAASP